MVNRIIREKQQPPSGPFWMTKSPEHWTDDERLRYAGMQFTPRPDMERALLVRHHLPAIYALYLRDVRLQVDDYAKQRSAKAQLGEWQPPATDPAVLDELRAAAALIEGERPPHLPTIEAERRAAFRSAVNGDDYGAIRRAWRAWQDALSAAVEAHRPRSNAHEVLGLPSRPVPVVTRPTFSVEQDAALGSPPRYAGAVTDGSPSQ